jgi:paraquat-inducible protein A
MPDDEVTRSGLRTYPELIACVSCDTVSERRDLRRGELALCSACGAVLQRARWNIQQLAALSLSAAFLFIVANATPMIGIDLGGRHSQTTLWGSVLSLADHITAPLAIIVALAIIVLPALQISIICWLSLFALGGRRAPWFNSLMRAWESMHAWSMVEVGMLAILVSYVKMKSLFDVQVGIGVWAMAGLAVLLTAIAHRDVRSLWFELQSDAE